MNFLSGCGSDKPVDPGKQATISGSVTIDGKPIATGSNVVYYCSELSATAAGMVDSLGKFTLKPADPKIGIPVGRYEVMVTPPQKVAPTVGTDEYQKMMMSGGTTGVKSDDGSGIPQKFQAFDTSKISLEVKSGPNTFDFDLAKLGE